MLQDIFRAYQLSDSPRSIELLVDLDDRVRALLNSRPTNRQCEDDSGIYDRQWKEIGVNLGYWVDLACSGRLLDEAHKRNPNPNRIPKETCKEIKPALVKGTSDEEFWVRVTSYSIHWQSW